ncbi:CaiB/BaiF CoA transferase family protein [Thermodesulfobacteriota bacterium]
MITERSEASDLPLKGIRVLEWAAWHQGPMGCLSLADYGADVVKIEQPGVGDPGRGLTKAAGILPFKLDRNVYVEGLHRNKRSLSLDLSKKKGRQILYELIEKTDIFVTNFMESVVIKNGADYETLSKYNPKLIYILSSGYGPKGPDADTRSYEYAGQARSGIMTMTVQPGEAPQYIEGGLADSLGAMMISYGAMLALFARERLGIGQRVDTSLLGGMIWMQLVNLTFKCMVGESLKTQHRTKKTNPLINPYKCSDGQWVVIVLLQSQRFWPNLCRALSLELENDPRFADEKKREENSEKLVSILDQAFATKTRDEWIAILKREDVTYSICNTVDDLPSDPQVLANEYITEFDHPAWGKIQTVGLPIQLSKTPGSLRTCAPELGQHTEEILIEMLDYDWAKITQLKDEGVI